MSDSNNNNSSDDEHRPPPGNQLSRSNQDIDSVVRDIEETFLIPVLLLTPGQELQAMAVVLLPRRRQPINLIVECFPNKQGLPDRTSFQLAHQGPTTIVTIAPSLMMMMKNKTEPMARTELHWQYTAMLTERATPQCILIFRVAGNYSRDVSWWMLLGQCLHYILCQPIWQNQGCVSLQLLLLLLLMLLALPALLVIVVLSFDLL